MLFSSGEHYFSAIKNKNKKNNKKNVIRIGPPPAKLSESTYDFCLLTDCVLWVFLMVPWVSLQRVIVVFTDHTHIRFALGVKSARNMFSF